MGVHVIPERDSSGHIIHGVDRPFASKQIDGKDLFKREHGIVVNCSAGDNVFDLVVPYPHCKMNEANIVWQPSGCTADFEVFDDALGTYSTIPNYKLNQFGYGVGLTEKSHHSTCKYDADVYQNMVIRCTITCPTGMTAQDICVNFILNELK
jgi:hypothetical protein